MRFGDKYKFKHKSFVAFLVAIDENIDATAVAQLAISNHGVDDYQSEFFELMLMTDTLSECRAVPDFRTK